jgi:hypothetical protein
MIIRKLLCEKCKSKVRTAEAIYQQERRKKIREKKLNKKSTCLNQ